MPPHIKLLERIQLKQNIRQLLNQLSQRLDNPPPQKDPHRKRRLLLLLLLAASLLLLVQPLGKLVFRVEPKGPEGLSYQGQVFGPTYFSPQPTPAEYKNGVPGLISKHITNTFNFISNNTNPKTSIGYSFTGDIRLTYWGLTYDNAMRIIALIQIGQVEQAKQTMDYLMTTPGIRKNGFIKKDGQTISSNGWLVNIIDASSERYGGRGVEYIIHTGPNAYIGIAAAHLFNKTGNKKYLNFAKSQWALLQSLQNTTPGDSNYGGIRMGPLSSLDNPYIQRVGFKKDTPSYYEIYNGEHAADFKALCNILAKIDPANVLQYKEASALIGIWDQTIYDKSKHLFFIGTTEKRYFDENIGQWVDPGIIPMYPLDTQALKISAYGVDAMEVFEKDAAEKIRASIEKYFKVEVVEQWRTSPQVTLAGYDFIGTDDRKQIIRYIEGGIDGDLKVNKGLGRQPLLSDEWSTWVAFADLKLAGDFARRKEKTKSDFYYNQWYQNSIVEGLKAGIAINENQTAYPYAHPLPHSLNQPVGFGWNTHHEPFALIGGVARTLGFIRFDPFEVNGGEYAQSINVKISKPKGTTKRNLNEMLLVEPELFVEKAWTHFKTGEENPSDVHNWIIAVDTIDKMIDKHPEWLKIALNQNAVAARSKNPFPLASVTDVNEKEAFSVYSRYWSLYNMGTAIYIKALSHSYLSAIYKKDNQKKKSTVHENMAKKWADVLTSQFYYAQTYDPGGWFWQPAKSVHKDIQKVLHS